MEKKIVLFSLFFFFLFLSLVYLDKGKERKVTAGQKRIEVICMQPEKLSENFFLFRYFTPNDEAILTVTSGFNIS